MTKRFAFVTAGRFSYVNEHVLRELRSQFPDLEADIVDIRALRLRRAWRAPRLAFEALREYGLSECLTLDRLRRRANATSHAFAGTRARLLDRLAGGNYAFTFQTQSLFDASTPQAPHFVYTDHSHLANLTYPAFPRANLRSKAWIDQERSIYLNATVNLTMSRHVSLSLLHDYGCTPEQVQCVNVGHHVDAFDPQAAPPARFERKNILFVGVDWQRKGGPTLVEAFRLVRAAHPSATLTIVGCSPAVDVPGCRVVGKVPPENVAEFYRTASVFCMPTRIEPFGIVFIEALANGLPVVATDIGAIPDFLEDGVAGYKVRPDDSAALAERLDRLLGHPALCAELGRRGYDLVRQHYTWKATGERIASHIRAHANV